MCRLFQRYSRFALVFLLVMSGCDFLTDRSDTEDPRDQLIGSWVIEKQVLTYLIVTDTEQTVLDPDAPAEGTMTLGGAWVDSDSPDRLLNEPLKYVRHGVRPIYGGYGPSVLFSTAPIQSLETVRTGRDEGIAVQLSDVYDDQQNIWTPDGYLEGIIETSFYQQYPGHLRIANQTLSADLLPDLPLIASPTVRLDSLPFVSNLVGSDTAFVVGTLEPATQTIPPGVETVVDTERTSTHKLDRREVTYTFTEDDSLTVAATANGSRLQLEAEWALEGDTLRIWEERDTTTVIIDFELGAEGAATGLKMRFDDPLCGSGDTTCRTFYEYAFGLAEGTLREGTGRITNDLVPKAESPASEQQALVLKREDRASACAEENTASDIFCNNRYLFQGGAPQLRPSSPVR